MIAAFVSSTVLALVAGAWALLEARAEPVEGGEGGCGSGCACRRRARGDEDGCSTA